MNTIFNEALADESCCDLDNPQAQARLLLGVKIQRENESGSVRILDTSRSSFYKDVDHDEQAVFDSRGWRVGVLNVFLNRYERRRARLNNKHNDEVNGKNRARVLASIVRDIETLESRQSELLTKSDYNV